MLSDNKFSANFIRRLRAARRKSGLTQTMAATLLGIGKSTYSNYENGHRVPDILLLSRFSNLFSISLDELCCTMQYSNEARTIQFEGILYSIREYEKIKNYALFLEFCRDHPTRRLDELECV